MKTIQKIWPYFDEDECAAVQRVLHSGKVNQWTGHEVDAFSQEFAAYHGVPYCVPLMNGTVALELAWKTLGIESGDEVIVTARSFIASAGSIALCGGTPVFVDVKEDSQGIDPEKVESAITPKTKAILAVHLAGWPCDMVALQKIAKEYKLYLVEDCAQSHGAKINGKIVGSWGDAAAFSFCQDKIMTTGGEGGALLLKDKKQYEFAWSYKDHGKNMHEAKKTSYSFRWLHDSLGTNWRMLEIQAAIGRVQLKKLTTWVEHRRSLAGMLIKGVSDIPWLYTPVPDTNIYHVYYKWYTFVKPDKLPGSVNRDMVIEKIRESGIPVQSGSCSEMYMERMWQDITHRVPYECKVAKHLGETSLMFQVDPTKSEKDVQKIISALQDIC